MSCGFFLRFETAFGAEGGIRTLVLFPANWFRVSPVMTASIPLHIKLFLNFARLLQGRWWNAFIQNSRKMKHLRDIARKQELSQVAEWWARLPFESRLFDHLSNPPCIQLFEFRTSFARPTEKWIRLLHIIYQCASHNWPCQYITHSEKNQVLFRIIFDIAKNIFQKHVIIISHKENNRIIIDRHCKLWYTFKNRVQYRFIVL